MAINPNWPLFEYGWGAWYGAASGDSPRDRYVEITGRTMGSVSTQRGRQYELDQVRSGECGLTLSNTDGALDPGNASGPFAGNIQPFQPLRVRAQYPPTVNLLSQAIATGGDTGGAPLGVITPSHILDIYSDTDATGGSVVASGTAWQGANVLQFSVPNASAVAARIAHTPQVAVLPGQVYTLQLRCRDVTAATSLQVKPLIGWYTAGSANPTTSVYGSIVTLTGSTTASWTQVTVTATAPVGAYGMDVGLSVAAAAGATCSIQTDGGQLEKSAAATTWTAPGVWYPLYAGFLERWPSAWSFGGTYGTVQPSSADAFSLLSQRTLDDVLTQELSLRSPRFMYRLDDPSGASRAADAIGAYPSAPVANGKYGAGSLVFGSSITATNEVTGTYLGSANTVATLNNPNPGDTVNPSATTFINLTSAGIAGPSTTAWTRMIAFRCTAAPSTLISLWTARGGGPAGLIRCELSLDAASGAFIMVLQGPGGSPLSLNTINPSAMDGNWHLVFGGYDSATGNVVMSIDGATDTYLGFTGQQPTGCSGDAIGALGDAYRGFSGLQNFKGDLSFAAEFPSLLAPADITAIYAAWKSAFSGDSTSARYARILQYAGYAGPTSIQTGLTTSMGPALIGGQDAVSALQDVVTTEGGAHYVATNGAVTFRARSARYNVRTPVYVFGENTAGGEWPYEDCAFDFDATHLANLVTVTQWSGATFPVKDATSSTKYFPRSLGRTINSSSALECQDAANYLLNRYKNPATRVSSIKLHPSALPALWPVCLSLELGTRVRVMRRPPGVTASQVECFVENIAWTLDDNGEAFVTLQCSPADTTIYGTFASWHTTLKTSVLAGVTSIVVNPSQDTTNPLATQLAAGQQIVLGQNTANQETVTVSSVGATSSGWTSATITLTGATTKAHTALDVICGVLPAGTTDPTTWDTSATLDAVAFSY